MLSLLSPDTLSGGDSREAYRHERSVEDANAKQARKESRFTFDGRLRDFSPFSLSSPSKSPMTSLMETSIMSLAAGERSSYVSANGFSRHDRDMLNKVQLLTQEVKELERQNRTLRDRERRSTTHVKKFEQEITKSKDREDEVAELRRRLFNMNELVVQVSRLRKQVQSAKAILGDGQHCCSCGADMPEVYNFCGFCGYSFWAEKHGEFQPAQDAPVYLPKRRHSWPRGSRPFLAWEEAVEKGAAQADANASRASKVKAFNKKILVAVGSTKTQSYGSHRTTPKRNSQFHVGPSPATSFDETVTSSLGSTGLLARKARIRQKSYAVDKKMTELLAMEDFLSVGEMLSFGRALTTADKALPTCFRETPQEKLVTLVLTNAYTFASHKDSLQTFVRIARKGASYEDKIRMSAQIYNLEEALRIANQRIDQDKEQLKSTREELAHARDKVDELSKLVRMVELSARKLEASRLGVARIRDVGEVAAVASAASVHSSLEPTKLRPASEELGAAADVLGNVAQDFGLGPVAKARAHEIEEMLHEMRAERAAERASHEEKVAQEKLNREAKINRTKVVGENFRLALAMHQEAMKEQGLSRPPRVLRSTLRHFGGSHRWAPEAPSAVRKAFKKDVRTAKGGQSRIEQVVVRENDSGSDKEDRGVDQQTSAIYAAVMAQRTGPKLIMQELSRRVRTTEEQCEGLEENCQVLKKSVETDATLDDAEKAIEDHGFPLDEQKSMTLQREKKVREYRAQVERVKIMEEVVAECHIATRYEAEEVFCARMAMDMEARFNEMLGHELLEKASRLAVMNDELQDAMNCELLACEDHREAQAEILAARTVHQQTQEELSEERVNRVEAQFARQLDRNKLEVVQRKLTNSEATQERNLQVAENEANVAGREYAVYDERIEGLCSELRGFKANYRDSELRSRLADAFDLWNETQAKILGRKRDLTSLVVAHRGEFNLNGEEREGSSEECLMISGMDSCDGLYLHGRSRFGRLTYYRVSGKEPREIAWGGSAWTICASEGETALIMNRHDALTPDLCKLPWLMRNEKGRFAEQCFTASVIRVGIEVAVQRIHEQCRQLELRHDALQPMQDELIRHLQAKSVPNGPPKKLGELEEAAAALSSLELELSEAEAQLQQSEIASESLNAQYFRAHIEEEASAIGASGMVLTAFGAASGFYLPTRPQHHRPAYVQRSSDGQILRQLAWNGHNWLLTEGASKDARVHAICRESSLTPDLCTQPWLVKGAQGRYNEPLRRATVSPLREAELLLELQRMTACVNAHWEEMQVRRKSVEEFAEEQRSVAQGVPWAKVVRSAEKEEVVALSRLRKAREEVKEAEKRKSVADESVLLAQAALTSSINAKGGDDRRHPAMYVRVQGHSGAADGVYGRCGSLNSRPFYRRWGELEKENTHEMRWTGFSWHLVGPARHLGEKLPRMETLATNRGAEATPDLCKLPWQRPLPGGYNGVRLDRMVVSRADPEEANAALEHATEVAQSEWQDIEARIAACDSECVVSEVALKEVRRETLITHDDNSLIMFGHSRKFQTMSKEHSELTDYIALGTERLLEAEAALAAANLERQIVLQAATTRHAKESGKLKAFRSTGLGLVDGIWFITGTSNLRPHFDRIDAECNVRILWYLGDESFNGRWAMQKHSVPIVGGDRNATVADHIALAPQFLELDFKVQAVFEDIAILAQHSDFLLSGESITPMLRNVPASGEIAMMSFEDCCTELECSNRALEAAKGALRSRLDHVNSEELNAVSELSAFQATKTFLNASGEYHKLILINKARELCIQLTENQQLIELFERGIKQMERVSRLAFDNMEKLKVIADLDLSDSDLEAFVLNGGGMCDGIYFQVGPERYQRMTALPHFMLVQNVDWRVVTADYREELLICHKSCERPVSGAWLIKDGHGKWCNLQVNVQRISGMAAYNRLAACVDTFRKTQVSLFNDAENQMEALRIMANTAEEINENVANRVKSSFGATMKLRTSVS